MFTPVNCTDFWSQAVVLFVSYGLQFSKSCDSVRRCLVSKPFSKALSRMHLVSFLLVFCVIFQM